MSLLEQPAPFEPYECSLGTVIGHDANAYRIATPDGRTIGIAANGAPSAANVEADIANPPAPVLSASAAEALLDGILDGWAREWGYASAARCITYVGDPNPAFDAEGVAMRNARSALWTATAAAPSNPETPPMTEANVRAFAAQFKPVRPAAP